MLSLLLIVNGLIPSAGDTRLAAVASLAEHCSAVLVAPSVALTAQHCLPADNLTFSDGQTASVAGVYLPAGGDAALLVLSEPVVGVEPVQMAFYGSDPGAGITLAGWGGKERELRSCETTVLWSAPESYIQFPAWSDPSGPGCGPEHGDSGGGVIVGDRARRVVGVIAGTSDATNLAQYAADPYFQAVGR